jgi:hypothetical protein
MIKSRAFCARELDLGASFPPRSSSSRASPRGRTSPRRGKRTRAAEATAAGKQTHDENEDRTRTPRHIRTQTSLLSMVRSFGSSAVMDTCCEGPEDVLFFLQRKCTLYLVSRARCIFCARRRFRPRRSKAPSRARHHQENVAGRSRRTRTPEATSKRRRGRARAPIVRETPPLVLTS